VVFLQETKWGSCDRTLWKEVGGSDFGEFLALDMVGSTGGIVVGWKDDAFSLLDSLVESHVVTIRLQRRRDNMCMLFSSIYDSTEGWRRHALWEDLG
jgi:hypothetical protein